MSTGSYTASASIPRFSASWAVSGSQAYQLSQMKKREKEKEQLELTGQQPIMHQQLDNKLYQVRAPLSQDQFQLQTSPNSPRFSSGGALAASNLYYLHWLKEKEKLEQQQKQQMDSASLKPIQFPINSLPASMYIPPTQGQFPYWLFS